GPRTRFAAAGRTEFPAERPSPAVHPDDPQRSSRPIERARLAGGSRLPRASGGQPPAGLSERLGVTHSPIVSPAKSPQPPSALKRKLASRCRTINDLRLGGPRPLRVPSGRHSNRIGRRGHPEGARTVGRGGAGPRLKRIRRSGTLSECTIRKTTPVRFPLQLRLLSARVASFWEPGAMLHSNPRLSHQAVRMYSCNALDSCSISSRRYLT